MASEKLYRNTFNQNKTSATIPCDNRRLFSFLAAIGANHMQALEKKNS